MKEIVAALDFSPVTAHVLDTARTLARALSAHLHLVHVVGPEPDFIGYEVGPQSVRDRLAQKYHMEHRQIQELADALRADGFEATGLLVQGPTVEKIVELAARVGTGLVIVGSHGHGALRRVLLGSVSEGLVRENRFSVLIVPITGTGDE